MAILKKVEKWLTRPLLQRLVYLLLLLLCWYVNSNSGSWQRIGSFSVKSASYPLLIFSFILPLLLVAQLIWNRKWLWWLLTAFLIGFTLWLATLSMSQIIAAAGSFAAKIVWAIGIIGFTAVLVAVLAFINWVLLHMKPKS